MPFPSRSRTALLAIALLLASLIVALAGASFLRRVEGFQPLGFSARAQGASWLVEHAGGAAALEPGDRLLLVDGRQPGPSETELRRLLRAAPTASLLVQRGEALLELDYTRPPVDVDWPYLVVVLVGLLYLFVGGYTLLRDRGGVAALFHLWCLASAAVYLLSPVPPFDLLGRAVFLVEELARVTLPALTLHLFLLFPAPLSWLKRRPRLPLFLYLPTAILLAAQFDLALGGGLVLAPRRETLLALERLELYWLVAGGLLGVALLIARLRRHPSWEQNRQLTWIAVGVSAGYVPFVLLYVLPLAVAIRPPELLAVAAVLPLACVPLAFAWAILRYKLWDIGVIVRDALATTVTVLLGVVAFSLVQLLAARGVPPSLAAARPLVTFAAGIAIASLVLPTRRTIGEVIERWQYRGTFRKRQALSRLGRELLHERQLERLADALLRSLEEALGLERLNLYLRQGERLVAARSEPGMPSRLTIDALGPALWTQDAVELAEEPLPEPEPGPREQLVAAGLRYAFPLTVRGSVLGLVVTGYRDGEQPLNSDDLELVRSLLDQSALAIENAQLMGQLQDRLAEVTRLERHTQGIIDSSPAGIAVLDAAQRVVSANSAFAELVGRPTASLVGTPIASVLPADALPPVGELAETVLASGAGTLRHVQLSIAPLGTSEQAILLLQDVSARVAMENALKEKERLAALGMLAAGVAHEVNTPITGISSYAQMLIADTPSEDPRYLLLKKVEKQTFRAARIVSNLLEFARDRARQQAPLTLQPLLREAVQMLEERIAEAGITVGWHLPSEPVEVVGNEGELQQVLTNLIVNAVDAMAPQGGGRLSLELGGDEATVRLAVVDSGPGIAPELLEQVFQPFFSTKLARGGTGLGLTISYNIVRRHGGSLRASSQPGEGSRFLIELPRYLRSPAS